LLKYLNLSESGSITGIIGNPRCYDIIFSSKRKRFNRPIQIPFTKILSVNSHGLSPADHGASK
jgi:hypothetical protein